MSAPLLMKPGTLARTVLHLADNECGPAIEAIAARDIEICRALRTLRNDAQGPYRDLAAKTLKHAAVALFGADWETGL